MIIFLYLSSLSSIEVQNVMNVKLKVVENMKEILLIVFLKWDTCTGVENCRCNILHSILSIRRKFINLYRYRHLTVLFSFATFYN